MTNLSASLRAASPAFSPSISKHWNTWKHKAPVARTKRGAPGASGGRGDVRSHLPAHRVQLGDVLRHVLVHVEGVDDGVDLESHLILLAPAADFVEVLQVALPALSSANQLVGGLVEAVARDGQDVQILT